MKPHYRLCSLLAGSILTTILAGSAVASHRAGDLPLPDMITAGDFNQDGNLDLAVNLSGFDNIAILDGNGEGDFTIREHVESDTLPKALAAGYVDKDDYLDLISLCKWGYAIRIYRGDGGGGFVQVNELKGDGQPSRISLADIDHDGVIDLIANAPSEGKVLIYLGLGGGGFGKPALEIKDLGSDEVFAVSDLNNDGEFDLVVIERIINITKSAKVTTLLGDGSGGFAIASQFTVDRTVPTMSVGDLNRDGKIDLLLAGAGPEDDSGLYLSSYVGDGAGSFALKQTIDLGTGALEGVLGLGDFDQDGNVDIAYPVTFGRDMSKSTTLLTFLGNGTGRFSQDQSIRVGAGPHSAFVADFNGDSHVDLAVTSRVQGTLWILLGDGSGTFTTHTTLHVSNLPQF